MTTSMLIADIIIRTLVNISTFYLGGFIGAAGVVHALRYMNVTFSFDGVVS